MSQLSGVGDCERHTLRVELGLADALYVDLSFLAHQAAVLALGDGADLFLDLEQGAVGVHDEER